ncbi:MAG: ABC transporter substrate-binding protein [Stackebrandtia sp.]
MSASVVRTAGLSRRHILGVAGIGALSPALTACGGRSGSSGLTLATTIATQQEEPFLEAQLAKFTDDTGIEVITQLYPDAQYANSIGLLFQGEDRPDVFRMVKQPAEMPAAYQKEWIQPLQDFDVVAEVLEGEYPDTARDPVVSGLHIGDDLYGMPSLVHRAWGSARPLMCNMELLDEYGVASIPETWSELREAAEKITRDSGGDVAGFGLLGQVPEPLSVTVYALQNVSGPQMTDPTGTPMNYLTGEPGASHESFTDTVAYLKELVDAEVVPDGWENLKNQDFWQQFANGNIAMAIIASWWWAEIHKLNPDVKLGFGATPVPDSGRKGYGAVGNLKNPGIYQPYWGMAAGSKHAEDAARLIAFLAGLEPQRDYYERSGLVTALGDKYVDDLGEEDKKLLELAGETERTAPNPISRAPESIEVLASVAQHSPKPTLQELFFDGIRGKIGYVDEAADFDKELAGVLDEEISKAAADGADVDLDTFVFDDWDPMKDYEA